LLYRGGSRGRPIFSSGFNLTGKRGRACDRGIAYRNARVDGSGTVEGRVSAAATLLGFAILMFAVMHVVTASAQSGSVLGPGNAVVTGFSGAPLPAQIVAGQNPADAIFIDPAGPSVQVFNLLTPGAPPLAQVIAAPAPFSATAAQVGQVFGVAFDNATPPNIYVAASSAYGLPIVATGPGGQPTRLHQGAADASFMPGLFGPATQGGGPGSIWRIGGNGAVTLFANVAFNGLANSGPALGGLAFDAASGSLLVADRQTGMIQRFNLSGTQIGIYDHGLQGRAAAGQPQISYDPSQRLDITKPQFNSDAPDTWGYAAPERRIDGLAVYGGRLYYAVAAGLQIWSVSLNTDGSFGADGRVEVQVPPAQGPTEISKIVFDGSGDMILAERGAPTGDYALMALAQPGIARVLGYAAAPGTPARWQPVAQYAIGFPGQMHNTNGGVAIGYGYDQNGNLDATSCSGSVWSTGEQMRNAADATLAAALAANGVLDLNGLQGNAIDLLEPANAPPMQSYFVDYDAQLDAAAARGHMGDVAIPILCGQAVAPPPLPAPLPPQAVPPLPPPPLPLPLSGTCAPGYVPLPNGACCGAGQVTSSGLCCPAGLWPNPNGTCQRIGRCPPGAIMDPRSNTCRPPPGCPPGMTRNAAGTCRCPGPQAIMGGTIKCVSSPTPPPCSPGMTRNAAGTCVCPGGQAIQGGMIKCVASTQPACPPGQTLGNGGVCAPSSPPTCPLGERLVNGQCAAVHCPPGEAVTGDGACVSATPCPSGQARNERGICAPACPAGQVRDLNGNCRAGIIAPSNPTPCPVGQVLESVGHCGCPSSQFLTSQGFCAAQCPAGFSANTLNGECTPPEQCPNGQTRNVNGNCETNYNLPCPNGEVRGYPSGECITPIVTCPNGYVPSNDDGGYCMGVPPTTCIDGQRQTAAGTCVTGGVCPPGEYLVPATGACALQCPSGYDDTEYGGCVPICPAKGPLGVCASPTPCSFGETRNSSGFCVPVCPAGQVRTEYGTCAAPVGGRPGGGRPAQPRCPNGQSPDGAGQCVTKTPTPPPPPPCPSGETRNVPGDCVKTGLPLPPPCPSGLVRNASGDCVKPVVPSPSPCPPGLVRNASGACVRPASPSPSPCPPGRVRNASGICVIFKIPPSPSHPVTILEKGSGGRGDRN
jgi:hypothetical protein